MATTVLTPAVPAGTARRLWRSPVDQPAYSRPALLAIAAFAVLLYAWDINHSQYHMFYANAARSMTDSWKAFFFGSFDPGNSITLDKLPGFLWPQALSARIFGFHPWALTLPQVIEGVASVLVLFRVIRRWAGVNAALISCVAFLLTPAAAGLFRTAVEDPAFTLCVLLAADATQRAAENGRLRSLILAGVWVGVGFQAKMLEAWAVLPALAVVYLVSAPHVLRKRIAHVCVAGLVMVAVSASWIVAVTLTPAKDRPYVDGTTNNSALSMVVGYNFLNRFSSLGISAASTGSVSATQGGGHGGGARNAGAAPQSGAGLGLGLGLGQGQGQGQGQSGSGSSGAFHHRHAGGSGGGFGSGSGSGFTRAGRMSAQAGGTGAGAAAGAGGGMHGGGGFGGQDGWGKMFGSSLASQTGWLYPLAAIAIVCGLAWRRGKPRTDKIRGGFLLWGIWLVTYFLVFSAGSVGGHTYYMGVIAVPLAALTGGGITLMWRAYRAGGRRAWALPAAVGATAAWGAFISLQFPSFLPWLAPVSIVLGLAAVVLLALARPGARLATRGRIALAGLLAGLAAVLIAPGAWAVQVFNPAYSNTMMGAVGPSGMGGHGGGGFARAAAGGRAAEMPWAALAGGARQGQGQGSHGAGRAGGMGGFGDSSGTLTAQQRELLDYTEAHRGKAEYVFATTSWSASSPYIVAANAEVLPIGGFTGDVPSPTLSQFQQLVHSGKVQYVLVSGGRGIGAFFGGGNGSAGSADSATSIISWVKAKCAIVPARYYGGGSQESSGSLYQCSPTH
ncbi:glycosyltransferase family 39 protein [Streptomyces sp. RB6PN25]|uniref:Glycosyltransferase family 39 protein n=1 Tax=Streptomyces humicola TaxID=2953240 RepID=A0ABT1PXQ9_9ACTN|nr:glycosyltransferase family 39 protein [Streptomyces humicola]MCQ4081337.1 glycosyltransferase family 39 protein [Streptomyces humicola]